MNNQELRAWFRDQLSANSVKKMEMLEDFAELQIHVQNVPGRKSMGADATESGATILVNMEAPFSDHSAYHELLHIERYWVQGVPRVVALTPDDMRFAKLFNDLTEHVPMAKTEIEAGYDAISFWTRIAERDWAEQDPTQLPEEAP